MQASLQSSVNPASLSFGNQLLNTTSNAQLVTLSATGNSCLKLSLAVTGDFAQTNTCGAGLPAGQICTISVTFTPSANGTRTGALTFNGNAASVPLSGTGFVPATASVSPSALNFGNQTVGTESPTQTLTVSNTGSVTMHFNSLAVTGDPDFFTLLNNCVGGPGVAPGSSCFVEVVFVPHSAGPGSATLTLTGDAINSPVSVSITGTGANPPHASVSPSIINFGNVVIGAQSPVQTITVTNTGIALMHVSGLSISGDPDFFVLSNGCVAGTSVSTGGVCVAQVAFLPHSAGPGSATVTITSDAANSPVSVPISGTGVNPPLASVSPTSINFGNVVVATESPIQTITINNTGSSTLHINSLQLRGDPNFFNVTNDCVGGAGIAPGGTCSAQMVFFPQTAGSSAATLTIGSDAANGPFSVSLSGVGVDYALSASPSSLSVRSGHQVQTTVTVSAVGGTFSNAVGLFCSGLPAGSICTFSPAPVTPGAANASSTLTINTQRSGGSKTSPGTYQITINGSSNSVLRTIPITLTVIN